MDNTRERDLAHLHEVFTDPQKSDWARQNAYRNFVSIQSQMKDRTLAEFRHRLVKAIQVNDLAAADKIEKQIRDHEKRQPWYRPPRTA